MLSRHTKPQNPLSTSRFLSFSSSSKPLSIHFCRSFNLSAMAVSSAIFTTVSIFRPSLSPAVKLLAGPLALPSANVRLVVRTVTCATASPKPATGERQPRGIMKPRPVSPEMAEFVGAPEISRTQALKLIWAHIKENNLQNPNNKKIIICDEKLKTIFAGKDEVGFLQIAGLITPHFIK